MAFKIHKLNEISPVVDEIFGDNYEVSDAEPHALMLRSHKLHDHEFSKQTLAVARCGAGVNNIPVERCSKEGIVVFNTPGANANAVKELVLCSLLLSSRKIVRAVEWANSLKGKGKEVAALVEKGKADFAGHELAGKKLGVVGLGAIGALVANAAEDLGMIVYGYDPFISVDAAWRLSGGILRIKDIDRIYRECDYITLHVPYVPSNHELLRKETLAKCKAGAAVINLARGELVSNADMLEAVASGHISRYVTDFPADELIGAENVICIPHLGASTPEAEENCAVAAANQLKDFLEDGNISNSVNFPQVSMPRISLIRITIIHLNIKEMINKITAAISGRGINIENFVNASRGEYAYTFVDIDHGDIPAIVSDIEKISGVIRIRVLR